MGEDKVGIELIDKNKAINTLIPIMCEHSIEGDVQGEIMLCLLNAPTVEAKPVVHGEWIKQPRCSDTWKCTNCGEVESVPTCMGEPIYSFCPNCGADMRGEKNG